MEFLKVNAYGNKTTQTTMLFASLKFATLAKYLNGFPY